MDKNNSTDYYSLEEYSDLMDLVEDIFTDEMLEGVYLFNWLKYRLRAGKKPGNSEHEDHRKAWTYYHMHLKNILRLAGVEVYREEDHEEEV